MLVSHISCTPETRGSAVDGWENIGKEDPDKPGKPDPEKPDPEIPEQPVPFSR